jgi:hypothetical protein
MNIAKLHIAAHMQLFSVVPNILSYWITSSTSNK